MCINWMDIYFLISLLLVTYLLTYLVPSVQPTFWWSWQILIFCWWQGHMINSCVYICKKKKKNTIALFLEEWWHYGECLSWAIGWSINQLLSALPHCGPINFIMCLFLCQYTSCCVWVIKTFLYNHPGESIFENRMAKWKNVHTPTLTCNHIVHNLGPNVKVALTDFKNMFSACYLDGLSFMLTCICVTKHGDMLYSFYLSCD